MAAEPIAFVVDDDDAMRDALAVHLKLAGVKTRTFASAAAFLETLDPRQPGCAIIDIRMPEMDGLSLQTEMANRGISLPVIIITGHGDVPAAVTAFRAGAVDFLQKPFDEDLMIERVREAFVRDAKHRQAETTIAETRRLVANLTPREREVMDLIAEGHSNKVIAIRLRIGVRTVETHRARLMEKTGARSVADLARFRLTLHKAK